MKKHPEARVFHTDTKFDRTIRKPGGVPREEAVARAQTEINAMMPDFEKWLDTALTEIVRVTKSFKKERPDNASIELIQRNSSYLQDLGETMGFALVTFVARNLCEIIEAVQNGAPFNRAIVECHVNALSLARQDKYRNLQPEQVAEMTEGLRQILRMAVAQK